MRFTRGTGCVFGVFLAVIFAALMIIAIIILVNAIKSIDYQAAANDLKEGIQEFNNNLRSINPTTVPPT